MVSLPVFLPDPMVDVGAFTVVDSRIFLSAQLTHTSVACPTCGVLSSKVHSRYRRIIADVLSQEHQLIWIYSVRCFACGNGQCPCKSFAEALPDAKARARNTGRLDEFYTRLTLHTGSAESASRLFGKIGTPVSGDTLLRRMRASHLEDPITPVAVLGVDDWAWKKGQEFGTILCDLETHRPIDLLPDRSAESLAAWLRNHPEIQVIARDRSGIYSAGCDQGAPDALQVADRWHLLKNLFDTLVRLAQRMDREIGQTVQQLPPPAALIPAVPPPTHPLEPLPEKPLTRDAELSAQRRAQRMQRYEHIRELRRQGKSLRRIAMELGLNRGTVRRFMRSGTFPERVNRPPKPSLITPLIKQVRRLWDGGINNAWAIFGQLRGEGFKGSYCMVKRLVQSWRHPAAQSGTMDPITLGGVPSTRPKRPSPRRIAWLMLLESQDLKESEALFIAALRRDHRSLAVAMDLAQEFRAQVRNHDPTSFIAWLARTTLEGVPREMVEFGKSLQRDFDAVLAALTFSYSNGQAEGQINRLKMIRRRMYGRGKLDLLMRYVLPAA